MVEFIHTHSTEAVLVWLTLTLLCIVSGLLLARTRVPEPYKHWLAQRREEAAMDAEEQAEQIIRSVWPEEEVI